MTKSALQSKSYPWSGLVQQQTKTRATN